MGINYYAGCEKAKAFELAKLLIQAYQFYNQSKKGESLPQQITLETGTYDIHAYIKGKAICIEATKLLGFIATQGNQAYVIFRGTASMSEWVCDGEIHQANFLPGWGKVHNGFHEIYTTCAQTVIDTLNKLPTNVDTLLISGHSLGAAISTLALADIMASTRFKKPVHYTYSSPRVGDPEFFEKFQSSVQQSYRIHNTEDIVPTEPVAVALISFGIGSLYAHVGLPFPFTHPGSSIAENHLLETAMKYL